MVVNYQADTDYNPLCASRVFATTPSQWNQNAALYLGDKTCLSPVEVCCCNCFSLNWPGITPVGTGIACTNIDCLLPGTWYIINTPCFYIDQNSTYKCKYVGGFSVVLTQWLDGTWTLVVSIRSCNSGYIVLNYAPNNNGFWCRRTGTAPSGTFNLVSVTDSTGCGVETYPTSLTLMPSDICDDPTASCHGIVGTGTAASLPTSIDVSFSSGLDAIGLTFDSSFVYTSGTSYVGTPPTQITIPFGGTPPCNQSNQYSAYIRYQWPGGGGNYQYFYVNVQLYPNCFGSFYYFQVTILPNVSASSTYMHGSIVSSVGYAVRGVSMNFNLANRQNIYLTAVGTHVIMPAPSSVSITW